MNAQATSSLLSYDDGKHRHICNRTRSYSGTDDFPIDEGAGSVPNPDSLWCANSVRMETHTMIPNMSHEAMMTAVAAPTCTTAIQRRQGSLGFDECNGRELLRRPMNFGLFSSEAPPT